MFPIGRIELKDGGFFTKLGYNHEGLEGFWISARPKFLSPKHTLRVLYLVVKYVSSVLRKGIQFPVHLCCATNHHPQAQSVSPSKINSSLC
jgi:hypothetical protein